MSSSCLGSALLATVLVAACGSDSATHSTESAAAPSGSTIQLATDQAPATTDATTAKADQGGAAEPLLLNYKQERKRKAMLGLSYDSGRVQVVPDEAKLIVSDPDASASKLAREQALSQIQSNLSFEAIASATKAVLLAPDSAPAYLTLGQTLLTKRMVTEATAAFETGLALDPASVDLSFALADALARGDIRQRSVQVFESTLKLDPTHVAARERLAIQQYYLGNYPAAWQQVHSAEASGHAVPPQFRALLSKVSPEPAR